MDTFMDEINRELLMNSRILIRVVIIGALLFYLLLSDSYLARRLVQLPELLLNNF